MTRAGSEAAEGTVPRVSPLFEGVAFENVLKCIHCGLCLEACPTYRALGMEQDSPRGRLYLMRGLWEGGLAPDRQVIAPLNRCLDCRACETACPSGVPYGELIEKTREVLRRQGNRGLATRALSALVYGRLFGSTMLLKWSSRVFRFFQRTGLNRLASSKILAPILPRALVRSIGLMPAFSGRSFKEDHSRSGPEELSGTQSKLRVALFSGCVMDVAEREIHEATRALLQALEFEVVVPRHQTCCGALHVHAGERKRAQALEERNAAAFSRLDLDALIVNAAGCGAQLKHGGLLAEFRQRTGETLEIFDILEFLSAEERWKNLPLSAKRETVLYDAPCHLIHAQGIDAGPRSLLSALPGVKLVPLAEADACCGAAGIYNLTQPELAGSILDRKLDDIRTMLEANPEASTLVTGNPGCLFQLRYGVANRRLPLRVIHPVLLIAERLA